MHNHRTSAIPAPDNLTTSPRGRHRRNTPRLADLRDLPPTLSLTAAARLLGVGRTTAYALVHRSQFPCPTFKVGHQHRISTAVLLQFLGVSVSEAETSAPGHVDVSCLADSSHQP
ncbi:DNA-binding protein [Streptacidiphilus pinicola]|uniref:DNA-binding protein n=1 Tax=Streptacidiphilus pinicola TaxID=2219663 RepID=A0A2X0IFJ8_9ACTN|nr:helix-turn-helix domain-containing protein [Streptacidiphilus pinicola]RAG83814.1 DNA-binding protein [Streptacidiphilus pinicola]